MTWSTLFEITQDKERLDKAKAYLLLLFEAKKLMPVIDKVFNFDQVQQSHEYMESNQQMGKIVIRVWRVPECSSDCMSLLPLGEGT